MSSTKKIVGRAPYAEKRRDVRRPRPTLVISMDGNTYPTMDWSLGGALLSYYYGQRALEEEIEGRVRLATGSDSYPFKGVVVRRDLRKGQMAFRFTELSNSAFTLLEEAIVRR